MSKQAKRLRTLMGIGRGHHADTSCTGHTCVPLYRLLRCQGVNAFTNSTGSFHSMARGNSTITHGHTCMRTSFGQQLGLQVQVRRHVFGSGTTVYIPVVVCHIQSPGYPASPDNGLPFQGQWASRTVPPLDIPAYETEVRHMER